VVRFPNKPKKKIRQFHFTFITNVLYNFAALIQTHEDVKYNLSIKVFIKVHMIILHYSLNLYFYEPYNRCPPSGYARR